MLHCPFCHFEADDSSLFCDNCSSDLTNVLQTTNPNPLPATSVFPWLDEPRLVDAPDRDPQETAFLRSIMENPDDDTPRLIFADWLEENGQPEKAAFVRLEVQLSRMSRRDARAEVARAELLRLDAVIGGEWTWALVRIGRLLNCGGNKSKDFAVRFAYECPNRWADLIPTEEGGKRFCGECNKDVHFCQSKEEAENHAIEGHCIAIDSRLALAVRREYGPKEDPVRTNDSAPELDLDEMTLGLIALPPSPYELWADDLYRRHRSKSKRWWQFWR